MFMFTDMMVWSDPPSSMRFALILFLVIHEIGSIWESHIHSLSVIQKQKGVFFNEKQQS